MAACEPAARNRLLPSGVIEIEMGSDFYTSSTLFGVTGWYEAVRLGRAAARKPSSQVLQGTPGYGLAGTSSGS